MGLKLLLLYVVYSQVYRMCILLYYTLTCYTLYVDEYF